MPQMIWVTTHSLCLPLLPHRHLQNLPFLHHFLEMNLNLAHTLKKKKKSEAIWRRNPLMSSYWCKDLMTHKHMLSTLFLLRYIKTPSDTPNLPVFYLFSKDFFWSLSYIIAYISKTSLSSVILWIFKCFTSVFFFFSEKVQLANIAWAMPFRRAVCT